MSQGHESPYEFLGEEIDVAEGDGVRGPMRFSLRGRDYETVEVERVWQDRGQPSTVKRPNWRTRHHRNWFEVRTRSGERFRIYLDRGTKKGTRWIWVAERRVVAEED